MRPFPVSVSLPPIGIVFVYDMEYIATLEGDAQLVTRDVEVIPGVVGEMRAVVELQDAEVALDGI